MNLKEILKDDIVLVIPNSIKKRVLDELNDIDEIYNIKIINLNELEEILTFKYNQETIYYLMNKYNFKYEVASLYIKNIRYLKNNNYADNKLLKLLNFKNELIENNLLFINKNYQKYLKDKEIIFLGYDYIPKFLLSLLNDYNYKIIEKKYYDYKHNIYEFVDIDEEIEFVAENIISLINDGVDINKIKLANLKDEYIEPLNRIFKLYNIPFNSPSNNSIYNTVIISEFIKNIDDENILEKIKEKYDLNNQENNYIYNKLINILNEYTFTEYKNVLPLLINDFKNTDNYIDKKKYGVEVTNLKDNSIDDSLHIFMLGFNQENIPTIYKDEEYLNDKLKNKLGLEDSILKNMLEKEIIINNIKSIKNLIITYKLKTPFNTYSISSLNDELKYEVIKKEQKLSNFSTIINHLKLASSLDELIKYGVKNNNIDALYNNFSNINYLKYDNKFKGVNKEDLYDFLDNKILLSYSSLDNYARCKFRYYINNVLKLSDYEETFAIKIGNIFHYVLSKCFDADFDFEKEFIVSINEMDFTESEKFFLDKLKEELKFIIKTIKEQNTHSSFDKGLYENKIYINKEGNVKLTFMGIIDKLLYKEEKDKTYLVIIDYKTGTPNTNLNNTIYGIDMQLPVYLYLADNNKNLKNIQVVGFYLQKLLNGVAKKEENKTEEEIKKDSLKLTGYSIDSEELLEKFDSSYVDSNVIKSMKYGKNGFYAYSKTITNEEIKKLIELVDKNIDNAFQSILDADFSINPKRIGKQNVGCEFCKYKDICYMREEDIVNLEEYKNLEFLN